MTDNLIDVIKKGFDFKPAEENFCEQCHTCGFIIKLVKDDNDDNDDINIDPGIIGVLTLNTDNTYKSRIRIKDKDKGIMTGGITPEYDDTCNYYNLPILLNHEDKEKIIFI